MNHESEWVSVENNNPQYYEVEYKGDYAIICRNCFEQIPNKHRMTFTTQSTDPHSSKIERRACVCCGCDVSHEDIEDYYNVLSQNPDDIHVQHDNIYELAKVFISGLYQTEVVPTINYRPISSNDKIVDHIRVATVSTPQRSIEIATNVSYILEMIGLDVRVVNAMDGMGNGQMIVTGEL